MCKAARQLLNTAKQQRKASPTMTSHLAEAGRTLIPRKDDRYGLLSPALVILTFVAGLVDALSYLALGHVFVANVTGNIVLYLVVFRFGLPECLEIRKRWYFNAFAILQVVTGYDCMKRNVTVFVCGLYAE